MATEGRAPASIRSYRETYQQYCEHHDIIEDRRVRRFLLTFSNLKTRNKKLAHLKAFVSWYGNGNEYVPAPIRVRRIAIPDSMPVTIKPEDADKLLTELRASPPAWALLTIMRETGMRFGEVYNLTRRALYEVPGEGFGVRFRGKGSKERIVPLTDAAKQAFDVWTKLRFKPAIRTIRRKIVEAEERSGVEHIRPHWFRSTLATNLVNSGASFSAAAELLGHSSTDILRKSYARLGHTQLAALIKKCPHNDINE